MATRIDLVPIDSVIIDTTLQPRLGGLDDDHIRALVETPESWPPIILVRRGADLVLVDGAHRLAAAMRLEMEEISAEMRDDDGSDLRLLAFALNAIHGRALSLRDKRAHAEYLLLQGTFQSNQAIAHASGVAASTVQAIRARLEGEAAIEETRYEPQSGVRVPSLRPGELPEPGIRETAGDALRSFLEPPTRGKQRRAARYLDHFATSAAARAEPLADLSPSEIASALVVVHGEVRAREILNELLRAAAQIIEIGRVFRGRAA